ncbi:MAG: TIGR04283 family arsenosugar biosynthesis glycosyltransferase [Pseudomonadota bacterium]|nr:TIGR04283 family arsenosugar biosynthesis glycosyltransferase [Pseudomonadota bacterium]
MPDVTLLLFTRYPQAGQTKTRLIPALGACGAALVQQQMTEQAVIKARQFATSPERRLEICFTGAGFRSMGLWLGFDLKYRDQGEGDLGQRMLRAVEEVFSRGALSVIVIGSDCPALPVDYLEESAAVLKSGTDLVLGPALDGGYYLIGMRRVVPSLFEDVPWGSENVLSATLKAAHRLNWRIEQLPPLADIDRPEDLVSWRQEADVLLSIVIPVLNEAENLPRTLEALNLWQFPGVVEVLTVDGGSCDDSVAVAKNAGCRLLSCRPGRGRQMNVGARAASGRYLLFLHADTIVPPDYPALICRSLSRPGVAVGAFSLAIADQRPVFRFLEKLISWRSRRFGRPYGDQGFFMSRVLFERVGSFWEEPLLEDVDLLRRLKKEGRLVVLPTRIETSARRWQRLGVGFTTFVNQLVMFGYFFRLPPKYLARLYRWHI